MSLGADYLSFEKAGPRSWKWKGVRPGWKKQRTGSPMFGPGLTDWCLHCRDIDGDIVLILHPYPLAWYWSFLSFLFIPCLVSVCVEDGSGRELGELRQTTDVGAMLKCNSDLAANEICIWRRSLANVERFHQEYQSKHRITFRVTFRDRERDTPLTESTTDTKDDDQSNRNARCLENLSQDLAQLLGKDSNPDVQLHCGSYKISAHRLILSVRSPILAKMLQCKMVNNCGIVELNIEDIDPDTLKLLVRYLYTGSLDQQLTLTEAMSLYEAGGKYGVKSLCKRFSQLLTHNLKVDSACKILAVADAIGDGELVQVATDYILQNRILLSGEPWSAFSDSHPKLANKVYSRFCEMEPTLFGSLKKILKFLFSIAYTLIKWHLLIYIFLLMIISIIMFLLHIASEIRERFLKF